MRHTGRFIVFLILSVFLSDFVCGTREELIQDALREIREKGPFYFLVPSQREEEPNPNETEEAGQSARYSNHISGKGNVKRPGTACPYSVWSNGCNLCTCDSDGEVRCTRNSCPQLTTSTARKKRSVRISQFPTFLHNLNKSSACAFGPKWTDGCFECQCDSFAQVSCRRLPGCQRETSGYCPFGESGWSDGCFKCLCQKDGTPYCQRRSSCPPRLKNKGEKRYQRKLIIRRSVKCGLGSWWYDGCDWCSCTHSRRTLCTTRCLSVT